MIFVTKFMDTPKRLLDLSSVAENVVFISTSLLGTGRRSAERRPLSYLNWVTWNWPALRGVTAIALFLISTL